MYEFLKEPSVWYAHDASRADVRVSYNRRLRTGTKQEERDRDRETERERQRERVGGRGKARLLLGEVLEWSLVLVPSTGTDPHFLLINVVVARSLLLLLLLEVCSALVPRLVCSW